MRSCVAYGSERFAAANICSKVGTTKASKIPTAIAVTTTMTAG